MVGLSAVLPVLAGAEIWLAAVGLQRAVCAGQGRG